MLTNLSGDKKTDTKVMNVKVNKHFINGIFDKFNDDLLFDNQKKNIIIKMKRWIESEGNVELIFIAIDSGNNIRKNKL